MYVALALKTAIRPGKLRNRASDTDRKTLPIVSISSTARVNSICSSFDSIIISLVVPYIV